MNPSVWTIDLWEISIRITAAMILGGIIGLEREWGQHHAGFRTHILVCVGAALITLISIYGFSQFAYEYNVRMDPARLTAQIVSGIGFLGAGTILRTGNSITGLTTAASLWVVAAIGIGVGAGFYYAAGLTALLAFICLLLLNKLEKRFSRTRRSTTLTIQLENNPAYSAAIMEQVHSQQLHVMQFKVEILHGEERLQLKLKLQSAPPAKIQALVQALMQESYLLSVETK